MTTLTDSAFIAVSPEIVEAWIRNLPAHYTEWHPAHSRCEVTGGDITSPGATFYFEELLHGEQHRLRARVATVSHDDGFVMEYRMLGAMARLLGMRGSFRIRPDATGSIFTATITVWPPALLSNMIFGSRMRVVAEHMQEEGENLKTILERLNPPYEV